MKLRFAIVFGAAAVWAAGAPQDSKPAAGPQVKSSSNRRAAAKAKAKSQPVEITVPPGAVEVGTGVWKFTDAKGGKWIYRKTPFGLTRFEDTVTEKKVEPPDPGTELKAVLEGEMVRFERPTPFGVSTWRKKLSDLDEMEREAVERARANAAASRQE